MPAYTLDPLSIVRVEDAMANSPAGYLRPGITAAEIAQQIDDLYNTSTYCLRRDLFEGAFEEFAYLSVDDVDDIRDAQWTIGGEPA